MLKYTRKTDTCYRRKFGISIKQYNDLYLKQNGVCAICKRKDSNRALAVDHCHKTKVVRGLLCSPCNRALGTFDDNIEYLNNSIQYLIRGKAPLIEQDAIKEIIPHSKRKRWVCRIKTPDGEFCSLEDAGRYYKCHPTTIRVWCGLDKINEHLKKDGFECNKTFEIV